MPSRKFASWPQPNRTIEWIEPLSGESIFAPAALLVLWTAVMTVVVIRARIKAVRGGQVEADYFRDFPTSHTLPGRLVILDRHFHNLLEVPVLFYAAVPAAVILGAASPLMTGLAWAFLASRLVHSAIHLTYNNVLHRLAAFSAGMAIVAAMWVLILSAALNA